jgi:ABC-2 type transport system ATP-binding protein
LIPPLLLEHVSKSFRRKSEIGTSTEKHENRPVLKNVTISVREGETVCILGKNGAGKTTLIRILSTLVLPDNGVARICGLDVVGEADHVKRNVGVMLNAGDGGFHPRLSARHNLRYYGALQLMPTNKTNERISDLLKELNLEDRGTDQSQSYSSGMRRRLALARALLHDPPVLLLDEPTLGVDPWTSKHIHEYLRKLSEERGKTILCTTNNVHEAEELGKRSYLLENGELSPWQGMEAGLTR